jgi:hypothetical protein
MEALGLSIEDLARIFRVSVRSARSWTTGGTRVPTWLMPALEIYGLLPPAARHMTLAPVVRDRVNGGSGRPAAPGQPIANVNRHPFARIEEL